MSDREIVNSKITSIPDLDEIPTLEEQQEEKILEVKPIEELETEFEPIEDIQKNHIFKKPVSQPKKKKQLSQRQLQHLENMRRKRAEKRAKKIQQSNNIVKLPKGPSIINNTKHNNIKKEIKNNNNNNKNVSNNNNFNSDNFFNNVERMFSIMDKYNHIRRPQQHLKEQPIQQKQQQKQQSKVIPKKQPNKNDPYKLNILNRGLYDNYRNPFNF